MKRSMFLDHVREVIRTNHFSYSTGVDFKPSGRISSDGLKVICTVQELPCHKDVRSTMIYTHVLNRNKFKVRSPLDIPKIISCYRILFAYI